MGGDLSQASPDRDDKLLKFIMRKKANIEKHNIRIAIFFVIFVCGIVFVSIVIKTMSVFAQSKFDGANRFTISVLSNKSSEVVSFSPANHSISILKVEGAKKNINLRQFLKIPIDGFIEGSSLKANKDVKGLMSNIFFNYNNIKTNLTIIDILRLILASKHTPVNNISSNSISLSSEDRMVGKLLEKLFKDELVEKENRTIEIINTTSISGLGSRLSELITNMGGNVVQVSTENDSQERSLILYNDKKSYTVEKLSKVLGLATKEKVKQSIAEITILIGEDNKDPLSF